MQGGVPAAMQPLEYALPTRVIHQTQAIPVYYQPPSQIMMQNSTIPAQF